MLTKNIDHYYNTKRLITPAVLHNFIRIYTMILYTFLVISAKYPFGVSTDKIGVYQGITTAPQALR